MTATPRLNITLLNGTDTADYSQINNAFDAIDGNQAEYQDVVDQGATDPAAPAAGGVRLYIKSAVAWLQTAAGVKTPIVSAVTTALSDVIMGDGSGNWVKQTIAQLKTALGLGTAAYQNTTAFDAAGAASAVQTNLNTHTGATSAHGASGNILGDGSFGWTTFTPSASQGGGVTIGVNYAKYIQIGHLVFIEMAIHFTAGGVASNPIQIGGLPVNEANQNAAFLLGYFQYVTAGGVHHTGAVIGSTTSQVEFYEAGASTAFGTSLTVANGDYLSMLLVYES